MARLKFSKRFCLVESFRKVEICQKLCPMFVHIQVKGRGFVMGIDSSHAPLAQNALNPNKMKYESC